MILYCDTSALMKLYVDEQQSDTLRDLAGGAARIVLSQLTWAEMCAGLGLKRRTGQIAAKIVDTALQELHQEWDRYSILGVDKELVVQAGDFSLQYGLRAYDSVQLASAQRAHQAMGAAMGFACFDKTLNTAARALGLNVLLQ